MLTEKQKKTAQAIVNIFETGKPIGDYGCVTVLKNDTGHLTYGRSQTTLGSGNLAMLIDDYCNADGLLSKSLKPFLPTLEKRDISLDNNERIKSLLKQAGDDPIMQRVQDEFFDRIYWNTALKSADFIGVVQPLSITVIYDSKIHGAYYIIRNLTNQSGQVKDIGEERWISSYVSVRRNWLANHSNILLHKTVYRMDSFKRLIEEDKWDLPLPLTVRNVIISEELFHSDYEIPVLVSAEDISERVLFYTKPMMIVEDVKRLQKALGFSKKKIDGKFGKDTDKAVRGFQKRKGLRIDGKVGPATWSEIGY